MLSVTGAATLESRIVDAADGSKLTILLDNVIA